MPPPADLHGQETLLNLDPFLQEGFNRKRSPKGKKGRKRVKDEAPEVEEDAPKASEASGSGVGEVQNNGMTQSSSILAQLHRATFAATAPVPAPAPDVPPNPLDAWEAAPPSHYPAPSQQDPSDWASSIPYGRSPPDARSTNGNSIGGSPPGPEYYQGHPPPESTRRGFSHAISPPISPRAAFRQTVARSTDYQSFGDYLGSSPNNRRPPSMYSQHTQHQPPLPHHPQAHFYGAPELDFGVNRTRDMAKFAGEGWCCKFDSLPSGAQEGSLPVENVLLAGFERGLDVFHVDKRRFDRIGRLAGLRGSVVGAKVLPSTSVHTDLRNGSPLIAVVIHGPSYQEVETPDSGAAHDETDEFDPSRSMVQALQTADQTPDPHIYETTVEVYSLRNGLHVQTLFRSPKVEVEKKLYGPPLIPPPIGHLDVQAKGRFVIISSGKSGEVYVFEDLPGGTEVPSLPFRCIGKIWTTIDQRLIRSASFSSTSSEGPGSSEGMGQESRQPSRPILSLSSRWLAFVPPLSSAQTTLHGTLIADGPPNRIHGVPSHTSPSEPLVTCQLDTPDAESYLNKVARDASQTLIKGARWVGGHGMQAWNSYWKPEQNQHAGSPPHLGPPSNQPYFPPTHAQDSKIRSVRNQATLVSMLDLEKLSNSQHQKAAVALHPLATFSLPNGCSSISFSPDGLKILTASAKGDVQQVWDLMRMVHGETGRLRDSSLAMKGPTVREIARFPRMTEAKIVDVVWTEPRGARLAILTAKGTAHIYDLPSSAFQWPPPRRITKDASATTKPTASSKDEEPQRPQTASSSLSSAFGMLSTTTSATLAAVRGQRHSSGASFPTFGGFAGAGAQGGKAVAAGVNRSVSAAAVGTFNTLRHLGENRITLPTSQSTAETITPGCIHWLNGRESTALAVTASGLVKIYGISRSSSSSSSSNGGGGGGSSRRPSVLAGKPAEFSIPKLSSAPTRDVAAMMRPPLPHDETQPPPGSFWRAPPSPPLPRSSSTATTTTTTGPLSQPGATRANTTHPLSYAEIDTSAAYQPFHTDRRVNFFVYDHPRGAGGGDPHHLHPAPPPPTTTTKTTTAATATAAAAAAVGRGKSTWLFGEDIPVVKVSSGNFEGGLGGSSDDGSGEGEGEGDDAVNEDDDEGRGGGGVGGGGGMEGRREGVGMEHAGGVEGRRAGADGDGGDGGGGEIVVTTTRRRRGKVGREAGHGGGGGGGDADMGEEIFEGDCEVVDFAEERV